MHLHPGVRKSGVTPVDRAHILPNIVGLVVEPDGERSVGRQRIAWSGRIESFGSNWRGSNRFVSERAGCRIPPFAHSADPGHATRKGHAKPSMVANGKDAAALVHEGGECSEFLIAQHRGDLGGAQTGLVEAGVVVA